MSHFWWKEDHFMHIECCYLLHHQGKIEIYLWFLTNIEFHFVDLWGFFHLFCCSSSLRASGPIFKFFLIRTSPQLVSG